MLLVWTWRKKIYVLWQSGKYVRNFPLWRMASFEENYRSWWSWKMMEMRSEIWSLQADLLLQTSTSWAFESHAGRYFLSEIVKHIMRANLDELVFFLLLCSRQSTWIWIFFRENNLKGTEYSHGIDWSKKDV